MRNIFKKIREFHTPLILIFILAVIMRCIMPFYLLMTRDYYERFMIHSSYTYDMLAASISIAKGEGLHLEYQDYVIKTFKMSSPELEEIQKHPTGRRFRLGGLGQILIAGGITYLMNSLNAPAIQIFQGILDSIGCLLIYGILSFYFNRRICLLGASIYAIWPSSIFYSYHFMPEAYTPLFMLAIGYMIILALHKEKWYLFALAGFLSGLSFQFRSDNALILPIYLVFILWFYRKKIPYAFIRTTLVFLFCILSFIPFKIIKLPEKIQTASIGMSVTLYNSLGEYPGNYKGLRFNMDDVSREHAIKKAEEYLKANDIFIKLMYSVSPHNLTTFTYIREVIIAKPILYANRLISRFIAYLPSQPFLACIAYFYLKPHHFDPLYKPTLDYRYSQLFHSVKYIDYLLFLVFLYGVWSCRRHKKMLSLLCIYIGVLVGHVIFGCGEVYFRMDKEFAYIDPRYLLGMVTIWPVFIAAAVGKKSKYFKKIDINKNE